MGARLVEFGLSNAYIDREVIRVYLEEDVSLGNSAGRT